ncbi:hypothetical protein ACVWZK_006603 [Bradyrhizobium sp. GM0.4]
MVASDYVPIFFKNRLHLAGPPQMSTGPNEPPGFCNKRSFLRTQPASGSHIRVANNKMENTPKSHQVKSY